MINRHLAHLWRQMKIHSCLFTLDRLPSLLLLRKNQFFSSSKTSQQSVRKPISPSFYPILFSAYCIFTVKNKLFRQSLQIEPVAGTIQNSQKRFNKIVFPYYRMLDVSSKIFSNFNLSVNTQVECLCCKRGVQAMIFVLNLIAT